MDNKFEDILILYHDAESGDDLLLGFCWEFHKLPAIDKGKFFQYVSERGPNWNAEIPNMTSIYFQAIEIAKLVHEGHDNETVH